MVYTRDQTIPASTRMSVGKGEDPLRYNSCCTVGPTIQTMTCDYGCGADECISKMDPTGDYLLISNGMIMKDKADPTSVVHNEHYCGKILPDGGDGVLSRAPGPVAIRWGCKE